MIKLKRVYEAVTADDGWRVLVDRLWPRGLSKEKAHIDMWAKDIAPSNELRSAFHHNAMTWDEFCSHYTAELKANPAWPQFLSSLKAHPHATLLFGAKDTTHNQAVVLMRLLKTT